MLEGIQRGLGEALKKLRGRGRLSEANVRDGLREVRRALLDADVNFTVADEFIKRVTEKSIGQKVLERIDPSEQIVRIVYEELVEGGITRFVAIYQSQAARSIGPIRSARPEDADILREYPAALAYSGGAAYVVALLRQTPGLLLINETTAGAAFHRVSSRPAPHNLYSSCPLLWAKIGSRAGGAPSPYFGYSASAPAITPRPSPTPTASRAPVVSVLAGTKVSIAYSTATYTARWRYDPISGRYLRSEGSVPHRTTSGTQLSAKNVLLFFVTTRESTHRDAAGHTTPIANMIGSGTVVLFRNGVRILGRWSRASAADRTSFTTITGAPLLLAPGNTWVELVPRQIKVTY